MSYRKFSDQIESVLEQIPLEQSGCFRSYFQDAPETLLSTINVEKRNADRLLMEEHESADKVYILLSGTVRAIDYRVKGSAYEHARFAGMTILGAVECVFGVEKYMTTVVTVTPCTYLTMPRQLFENWIWQDLRRMRREMKRLSAYLLDDALVHDNHGI